MDGSKNDVAGSSTDYVLVRSTMGTHKGREKATLYHRRFHGLDSSTSQNTTLSSRFHANQDGRLHGIGSW